MTGEEYLNLTEGDLCKLTEDIETSGLTWNRDDIVEILYRDRFQDIVYVKNPNVSPHINQREYSVKALSPLFFLKAMEVYKKWKDKKTDTIVTKFEHKFMPGDTFWVMEDNKPHSYKVSSLSFGLYKNGSGYHYNVENCNEYFMENEMFRTKEELLKSFL